MSKRDASLPDALPIDSALGRSDVLQDLQRRLRVSAACLQAARELLPEALGTELRSGVLDEKGWNLLVSSSAAAAKLRQWLPLLQEGLKQRGLEVSAIKVRVQSGHSAL